MDLAPMKAVSPTPSRVRLRRGLARPTCARIEDAIIPIAFDKTDLRLSLQSSSHPSGKQVPSCTSYIGIADPPRVRTFQTLRHCLGPHYHVPPPE
jgi:hypothetical protein